MHTNRELPKDSVLQNRKSPNGNMSQNNSKRIKKIALFGIFLAFMLVIGLIEKMIPLDGIAPGMRLGLANLAVVISLYTFKPRDILMLVAIKCVLASVLSGSVMTLFYSMSGSLASIAIMLVLVRFKAVSTVGISVAGAAFHNIAQMMVARVIFGTWSILAYLPLLLVVGTVSGTLIGMLAKMLLSHTKPNNFPTC